MKRAKAGQMAFEATAVYTVSNEADPTVTTEKEFIKDSGMFDNILKLDVKRRKDLERK
jgi:hypothetical protein